jgi:predicted phage terminase large subunit-like protein
MVNAENLAKLDATLAGSAIASIAHIGEEFDKIDGADLDEQLTNVVNLYYEYIRHAVLVEGRIEVLIEDVIGYEIRDFHAQLLYAQDNAPKIGNQYQCMLLAFRGGGKSTHVTVCRIIFELLRDPELRILIASNTQSQAEVFLREIKAHFEANEVLRAVFGDYVGSKWDNREITISKRTKVFKEASVTCIGVGGPTAGRHYMQIYADDLVDEENSRTQTQREKLQLWYYKSLLPTLEPDGRLTIVGTRWNPEDLYAHIEKTTDGLKTTAIKAISDDGTSVWPERFSLEHFLSLKKQMGVPAFESQYQMNTAAMVGKIFTYAHFQWFEDLPLNVVKFTASDLAITTKDESDFFANLTIAVEPSSRKIYVDDYVFLKVGFNRQTEVIMQKYYFHKPLYTGIEANAYQLAQVQNIQDKDKTIRVRPIYTLKDKVTRAMKLAARIEAGEILFRRSQTDLIEQLLKMPDGDHDDLFDALDLAVTLAGQGTRRTRNVEPGVM